MPAGATIAHYKGLGLDLIPGTGLLPACVPGTFDAYMLLLRDYGTMRLRRRSGARHRLLAERLSAGRARLGHHRHRAPSSSAPIGQPRRRSSLPGDKVPSAGSLFRNHRGRQHLRPPA